MANGDKMGAYSQAQLVQLHGDQQARDLQRRMKEGRHANRVRELQGRMQLQRAFTRLHYERHNLSQREATYHALVIYAQGCEWLREIGLLECERYSYRQEYHRYLYRQEYRKMPDSKFRRESVNTLSSRNRARVRHCVTILRINIEILAHKGFHRFATHLVMKLTRMLPLGRRDDIYWDLRMVGRTIIRMLRSPWRFIPVWSFDYSVC